MKHQGHLTMDGQRMIIESESMTDMAMVVKWTITGENRNQVNDASNALMHRVDALDGTASFSFPHKIIVKDDPYHGWFRVEGYTSENVLIDAHMLQLKEYGRGYQ